MTGESAAPPPLMLLDTPGQIISTSVSSTANLSIGDARLLHPKRPLAPVAFELQPGKSLLLGGLGVIEHTSGAPVIVRVFVAEGVTVHSTDASKAEDVRQRHCGGMLTPPTAPNDTTPADKTTNKGANKKTEDNGAAAVGGAPIAPVLNDDAVAEALALEAALAEIEAMSSDDDESDHADDDEVFSPNHTFQKFQMEHARQTTPDFLDF